jgi:hypothetical protein
LKQELHVFELEEAVDKEVALLEVKNAAWKQWRAMLHNDSKNENDNSISDSRWEAIHEFMTKWEPKLKRWNELMDRIEVEEIVVKQPVDVRVDNNRRPEKQPELQKEANFKKIGENQNPEKEDVVGVTKVGLSSLSEGSEIETSDGKEGEGEVTDLDEQSIHDNENESIGVVESDYTPSCKQVADHIHS